MTFEIRHSGGDEAEAFSLDAANTAARTLVEDNDGEGTSHIWRYGQLFDSVSLNGGGAWLHSRGAKAGDR